MTDKGKGKKYFCGYSEHEGEKGFKYDDFVPLSKYERK